MSVLDHEHHQKCDDGGRGVDDELPGVGPPKDRAGASPNYDNRNGEKERQRPANLSLDPTRKPRKKRGWLRFAFSDALGEL